jgi:hypothetical protein
VSHSSNPNAKSAHLTELRAKLGDIGSQTIAPHRTAAAAKAAVAVRCGAWESNRAISHRMEFIALSLSALERSLPE